MNSESLKSVITSYLFFTMLFQITKIFLNESNFYFENKCNKKSFLAVLDLHCFARAFSSCGEQGYSSLQYAGFSLQWLLVVEHRL